MSLAVLFNFGSINIDHLYRVERLPKAGETISAHYYERFLGGKGLNQSVAALRSKGAITHVGLLGHDGDWARAEMARMGLSDEQVLAVKTPSGHAIVYVDNTGENQIVIIGGANHAFTPATITQQLNRIKTQDWVLLQNETNLTLSIAAAAQSIGAKVCYSAAPFNRNAVLEILPHIDLLAVNEHEAREIGETLDRPIAQAGPAQVLVTYGKAGAKLFTGDDVIEQTAFEVTPIDTTGAGDTFLGAFIARLDCGDTPADALCFASAAAALQVTKQGAASAIPYYEQIKNLLKTQA